MTIIINTRDFPLNHYSAYTNPPHDWEWYTQHMHLYPPLSGYSYDLYLGFLDLLAEIYLISFT